MDAVIDANTPVDCIEFHIVPSQNRYEACVCYENKKEKVTSGLLEHLLLHSVDIKAHSEGSDDKYKLYPPENLHDKNWFTKSTLIRFLHIIGSENLLEITNSLKTEISQLEEARRFHLSLYAKADDSDSSKNELLRAMDLRLNALREELTTAFDQAAGSRYSVEEMTDIEKFSRHLGSTDLGDSLGKHIELMRGAQTVQHLSNRRFSESDGLKPKERSNHAIKSVYSELPVIYGVSPAKAAQVERQCSTGSDESSISSEEEQPSVERSRPLMRSASPRRSASPMRRVQIGRSGSRRSTAITIKSLNYFPSRDRMSRDLANDSDEELEQVPKKPENNARRMSVQDAINLFERKQKDQTVDVQKARSLLTASIGANKSVLRRWSSGMGEDSSQCPQDDVTEVQNNVESKEVTYSSQESDAEQVVASEDNHFEPSESDVKFNSPEKEACTPEVMQEETRQPESTDVSGKLITSAEWSRQKEAELNELLMKMMETKPVKSRTAVPARSKRQSLPSEQRGGFYDHYKEKRDEKLQGEAAKKSGGKDKIFRGTTKQGLDAKKSQLSPANGDAGKKPNVKKLHKPQISAPPPANPKAESPKVGVVKKASTKSSSLPTTRKSWPSMPSTGARGPSSGAKGPSPGARGPSPDKIPGAPSATGAMPTRRRSQPTPVASQVSSKVETSQIRAKSTKPNPNDSKKILKPATEKKQPSVTKSKKTAKSNVQTATEDNLVSSAKPNLYSKVTKKSSVVPLESKPFLRKGSGNTSGVNPTLKKKASPQEPLRKSEDLTLVDGNLRVSKSPDLVVQHEVRENKEFEIHTSMESETCTPSPQQCNYKEDLSEVNPTTADGVDRLEEPELKSEAPETEAEVEAEEESTISPTAWVEIEEQDHSMACGEHSNQMAVSPAYKAQIGASSPRVRHSLSQMLLEESSEPDGIDWGIAENPPAMVYHKDAPKGLKRLLKFARKSKTDANSSGWSSPSVFSEGEDDSEDSSRFATKRSSENLLRIATYQSKNNGHQKNVSDYEHHAQANIRKVDAQSLSQQFQEGNVSASVTTTKATRSFFSLSAFKGSK